MRRFLGLEKASLTGNNLNNVFWSRQRQEHDRCCVRDLHNRVTGERSQLFHTFKRMGVDIPGSTSQPAVISAAAPAIPSFLRQPTPQARYPLLSPRLHAS